MREVVVEPPLADQPALHELLERGDRLLVAAAGGGADGVDLERATDDRGGGEHLAAGLADRVEAGEEQLARALGQRPVGIRAERVEVLDEQEREPLGLLVEAPRELGRGVGDRRAEQLADLVLAQPVQPDDGRRRPPQRRARGQQHEQAAPAEPAHPVGEEAERGLVGPLDVVDHQQPRDGPGRGGGERLPHAVEEPRLRSRPVERRGRGGAEVGQQPRRLAQRAVADGGHPRVVVAQPPPQRLDHRPVRERGLLLVGAAGEHRGALLAHVRDELLGQPRLADPGLALQQHRAAVAGDAVVGAEERRPFAVAADQGRARRRRGRSGRARPFRRRRLQRPFADRLVQPRRLRERRHTQLARQRPHALAVLRERRRAVAALGVEPDQRPVGRLVERVELEPALRHRHVAGRLDQPREHGRELA